VIAGFAQAAAAQLQPTADYRFQNSRRSSVAGVPALVDIGPGRNRFGRESVTGKRQAVLRFPHGNGVSLSPATRAISRDEYTVVVLFNFDRVRGYRRILDLDNGGPERGLYEYSGSLTFWPLKNVGRTRIVANRYHQVALTRTAAGTVTGYVDGIRQWQFDDSRNGYAVIGGSDTMRFFRDNEHGIYTYEHAPGAVARIRLFDHALTPSEVAALPKYPAKPTLAGLPANEPRGTMLTGNNSGRARRAPFATLPGGWGRGRGRLLFERVASR
jgi:hypothetical protein